MQLQSLLESSSTDKSVSVFPAIIGRRPRCILPPITNSGTNFPDQLSPLLSRLVIDCIRQSQSAVAAKPVFVPRIGWATQHSADELHIQFNDGARLLLNHDRSLIRRIRYTAPPACLPDDVAGQRKEQCFKSSDPLPVDILQRLEVMPMVIEHLRFAAGSTNPQSSS